MGPYYKKDLFIYWRDRKEILVSLILPLIIIIVLGYAMPDWIENTNEPIGIRVAVVHEDDEQAALQQFHASLSSYGLSAEAKRNMEQQAEQLSPVRALMQLFRDEQVALLMDVEELDAETALQRLESEQIDAIITVPQGYTLAALNKTLLNVGDGALLTITANEAGLYVDIVQNVLDNYMTSYNLQTAIGHSLGEEGGATFNDAEVEVGGHEILPGVKMVTAFQYYSLAMAILFALFISTTTASKAAVEKRDHVFQRIMLTGSHPARYLFGKASSTFCLSFVQLTVTLLVSHFALNIFPGRSMQFWFGMSMVLILLALVVSAMSALFTSLVFRFKEETANNLALLLIIIAGTIGGSFVPIYILPEWLQEIGQWTPNGVTLSALIQWLQQESFADLIVPLVQLASYSIVIPVIGLLIFPRRRRMG